MEDDKLKHIDWHQNMNQILAAELRVSQLEQRLKSGEPVGRLLDEALAMLFDVEVYVNLVGIERVMGIK